MNIKEIEEAWERLGNICVDEDDNLEEDFTVGDYHYEKGTDKFVVWHCFDELCPNGLVKDLMPYIQGEEE